MTPADIVGKLEAQFGPQIKSKSLQAIDAFVVVEPADLLDVATYLRDNLHFEILNCISGVDYLEPDPKKAPKAGFEPHVEVVYHLSSFSVRPVNPATGKPGILRFVLKVLLPRWKDGKPGELPEVPSVTSLWAAAEWHEREVYDLAGVRFIGHPELTRILLAEDWEGHPLRKDYEFPLEYHGTRGR
jgi:NADH-quinone oxidoreductase subunit C